MSLKNHSTKIKIIAIFATMNDQKKIAETPLMRQYFEIKAKHPEALLLFRVGDFYETFADDAVTASKVLGIVLTKRANGSASHVELAGFPHHSLDTYLPKLVRAGYKVAVCDQLEDPKLTKKIVKRGVTELVTPGIAMSDQLLSQKENNYLASLYFEKDKGGIALLDVSTGTFRVAEGSLDYIELLLSTFAPKEVLLERGYEQGFRERFGDSYYISRMDEWAFVYESAQQKVKKQLSIESLKGYGVDQLKLAVTAAGATLFYLELTHHGEMPHICTISRVDEEKFVWMDRFTLRNLEVFGTYMGDGSSLLSTIERSSSPMGARMLRSWVAMPLIDIKAIEARHNAVEFFVNEGYKREELQEMISKVGDLERIVSRAAAGKVTPRELLQMKRGLEQIPPIKEIIQNLSSQAKRYEELTKINQELSASNLSCQDGCHVESTGIGVLGSVLSGLDECGVLKEILSGRLAPDAANQIGKGDVIASGVDSELDELRNIAHNGKSILLDIQQRECDRTGISSLKISYNNVFGYYLEVRNTHKDKVPADWIRKQTLVSAERYITQELKEYEEKILGAEQKILEIEQRLFNEIICCVQKEIPAIQNNAKLIAELDCYAGFAQLARENNYCRPKMNDSDEISIIQGRHPVIETLIPTGEKYVANDLFLSSDGQQIIILTGPNMSGKSAFLRQTALIVLLAQAGSFVPAASAEIGCVDKIFTRVGASDNISKGESTFMVEMLETSTILHNISARSLVLLDEIGRGTSTYDGMSIAWAIVEYIHENGCNAKTLFATHYHELNDLENIFPRVKNFHISTKEIDGKIIFLRTLKEGGVAHSFGIHVAQLAGMPKQVVRSAERILKNLEENNEPQTAKSIGKRKGAKGGAYQQQEGIQLSFFQLDDPLLVSIRDKLKEMDLNTMSPMDAFDLLRSLKKEIGLK